MKKTEKTMVKKEINGGVLKPEMVVLTFTR